MASCVTARSDAAAESVARRIVGAFAGSGEVDLAVEVCARFPIELLAAVLDLPDDRVGGFAASFLTMSRGVGWEPRARQAGLAAMEELADLFRPLFDERAGGDGDDLVSVVARLGGGPRDLVVTLLEGDHETLHGGLANLWYLLATHPEQLALVRDGPAVGQVRLPRGAPPQPAGALRRSVLPPRGRALRSAAPRRRAGPVLGGSGQPRPPRVRRPGRVRRRSQGPVPARAAWLVPGRRAAERDLVRHRPTVQAPGRAGGSPALALRADAAIWP